jgi:alpha-L-fucosidase 2
LFNACIESSKILGVDEDFRTELTIKRARLAPTQIGSDGRVMEWPAEYKEPEPKHRHVSHLWGLYPGDEISPATTPALAQAARQTLMVRGDNSVGWSYAFKSALWARLGDGNHAWRLIRGALRPVTTQEIRYDNGGGVYANLFDACPPFQIDANFGVTAAIAEMLLQSQNGTIELLPALPDAWKNGKVSGLRARGGFQVDIAWQNGKLTSVSVRSDLGEPCCVSYAGKKIDLQVKPGRSVTLDGNLEINQD